MRWSEKILLQEDCEEIEDVDKVDRQKFLFEIYTKIDLNII